MAAFGDFLLELTGRLHVLVVHFPIGLLLTAGLLHIWSVGGRGDLARLARILLGLGAISAAAAAGSGWLSADYGGGTGDAILFWHRWLGVALAAVACLTWLISMAEARRAARDPELSTVGLRRCHHLGLLTTVGLVAVVSHFGGSMVHGSEHLTSVFAKLSKLESTSEDPDSIPVADDARPDGEKPDGATEADAAKHDAAKHDASTKPDDTAPVAPANPRPDRTPDGAVNDPAKVAFFVDEVKPIFEAHCFRCHGPAKRKGGFRFDLERQLLNGDIVAPGDLDKSELSHVLDADAEERMPPPKQEDPLSADHIAAIRKWIADGAVYPAGLEWVDRHEPKRTATAPDPPAIDPAVIEVALARAESAGFRARWASLERAVVVVSGQRSAELADADLAVLAPSAPVLAELDLSATGVTGSGFGELAGCSRLERIDLRDTAVGDAGLVTLAALPRLESLVLVGTQVTDEGLAHLSRASALARLYLWRAPVTDAGVAALIASKPTLSVNRGVELPATEEPKAVDAKAPDPAQ